MHLSTNLAVLKGVFAIYAGLLVIAAATDVTRFIIPNWVSVALSALLVGLGLYLEMPLPWWGLHFGAGALLLLVGVVAWMLKLFGAGDVKLLAAVGLYSGVGQVHSMLLYIALAGGVLALALIALRRVISLSMASLQMDPEATARLPRILIEREQVPYGLAIAAGAVLAGYQLLPGLGIIS